MSEGDIGSGVADVIYYVGAGSNLDLLEEQLVLLTIEPPLTLYINYLNAIMIILIAYYTLKWTFKVFFFFRENDDGGSHQPLILKSLRDPWRL